MSFQMYDFDRKRVFNNFCLFILHQNLIYIGKKRVTHHAPLPIENVNVNKAETVVQYYAMQFCPIFIRQTKLNFFRNFLDKKNIFEVIFP